MTSVFDSILKKSTSSREQLMEQKTVAERVFVLPPDDKLKCHLLEGFPRRISSPLDSNISPSPGDDTSAPNSIPREGYLNSFICALDANAGFSDSEQITNFLPTKISHKIQVVNCHGGRSQSVIHQVVFEFSNPHSDRGESMMIWVKKLKQNLTENSISPRSLQLIDTLFQDFVDGKGWIDITTTTRYTAQAEAIVQAVVTSNSGQAAGLVKCSNGYDECKIGPVGSKGRVIMTFQCDSMYSYSQMSSPRTTLDSSTPVLRNLVPIALFLPFAAIDDESGDTHISVQLEAPERSTFLDITENFAAYQGLHKLYLLNDTNILVPSSFSAGSKTGGTVVFSREWSSLPTSKTAILFWLSIPDYNSAITGPVESLLTASEKGQITIYEPIGEDATFQSIPLSGGGKGMLLRATVKIAASVAPRNGGIQPIRVFTNLLLSDASGSTGMRVGNAPGNGIGFGFAGSIGNTPDYVTVQSQFNLLEVIRIANRLRTIPTLLSEGLVRGVDYWAEVVYIFDTDIMSAFSSVFQIQDVAANALAFSDYLLRPDSSSLAIVERSLHRNSPSATAFASLKSLCDTLRAVTPRGGTSFDVPADAAASAYSTFQSNIRSQLQAKKLPADNVDFRTFVNFDTDGGHNGITSYLSSIQSMVSTCHVVSGIVNGYGSWVNQHCATEVSLVLKGPCQLCTEVPRPGSADMNDSLLRDLSCWMRMIRFQPVKIQLHAGSVTWKSRIGNRFENAMDVFAVKSVNEGKGILYFELPDVSLSTEFTSTTITGSNAGDVLEVFLLTRLETIASFKSRLFASAGGEDMQVIVEAERQGGVALGYQWVSLLSGALSSSSANTAFNRSVLPPSFLRSVVDYLSFNWNIPSPTGSTALLGREKTTARAPIAISQQPSEPESRLADAMPAGLRFLGSASFGGGGGRGGIKRLQSDTFSTVGFGSAQKSFKETSPSFGKGFSFGAASPSPTSKIFSVQKTSASVDEGNPGATFFANPNQLLHFLRLESEVHKIMVANIYNSNTKVEFLQRIDALAFLATRMQQDPTAIAFFCDSCKAEIPCGSLRAHCTICYDFDLCERCYRSKFVNSRHIAGHLTKMVTVGRSSIGERGNMSFGGVQTATVDPTIANVFQITETFSTAASSIPPPLLDIRQSFTHLVHKRILIRFLLALRDWGILISAAARTAFSTCEALDLSFDTLLTENTTLVAAFRDGDVRQQLELTGFISVAKIAEVVLNSLRKQLS